MQLDRLVIFGCALLAMATACVPDDRKPGAPHDLNPLTPEKNPAPKTSATSAPGEAAPKVQEALATLRPTEGHTAQGVVRFVAREDGSVDVIASVAGLERGAHAFHVHEFGDCSATDGKSAGSHFNFQGDGEGAQRITGNLGELNSDEKGAAVVESVIDAARLSGPRSIVGRAVVVHEAGNDPAQPPLGGAGGRVACGVIGIANKGTGQEHAAAHNTATTRPAL